ncbi:MAG: hypothetical protein WBB01_13375 [Phormidesmis sp.]
MKNEEQALLVEKAKESLKAAQLLSDENMHGFAVSRAYYSMFYSPSPTARQSCQRFSMVKFDEI